MKYLLFEFFFPLVTKGKAESTLKVLKALTSTEWSMQNQTLLATYKPIVLPVIEYASTAWSPNMAESTLRQLQSTQNSALRIITGCTADAKTQHLHIETKTLPLSNHLKLHASQLRQKSQLPAHPHNLLPQPAGLREMKETIFDNWSGKTITIKNDNNIAPTT